MSKKRLFDGQKAPLPIVYPEAELLKDAIRNSYWVHTELSFTNDINQIEGLDENLSTVVIRAMLAISTVEVKVKDFWGKLGDYIPYTEWNNLGATHNESEARHFDAYSHILRLLDLEEEFDKVFDIPALDGRFNYLTKYLQGDVHKDDHLGFIKKLILFSVLIENVSLFSQFAILVHFYRHMGVMHDIRNIISWTSVDETIHFQTGAVLINIMRREYPEYFTEELTAEIFESCRKSIEYEGNIVDWIYEFGGIPSLPKDSIINFMKDRINNSMRDMGFEGKVFEEELNLEDTVYFEEEINAPKLDDFFAIRPTDYTQRDKSFNVEDMF